MSVETTTPNVIRAGCYLRISSDPKDKREGVDRQREDTTALCEVKGWTPAVGMGDGRGFYVDNDRSASNGKDRPQWDRLLADVKAGRIDAIAAWDQDRGWRVMAELEQLRKFFTGLGRRIPLATTGQGDIDLYSPTGVLAAQIKTAVSEHEIAMMKVRMRRAARQKAENGIPQWTHAFGYMSTDDGPVPDPVIAPLVRQAYAAIVAGGSLADCCAIFNDAGKLSPTGKLWYSSLVADFLKKPRNAGLRDHNGEIVGKGSWPGLVDEDTWRAAQAILNSRRQGRKSVRRHRLTGLLVCGKCGATLSGHWSSNKVLRYSCTGCSGVAVRAADVEPIVYGVVSGRLAMADAVDLLKAELHDQAEAEALRTERNTLLARLGEIADERADGLIDARAYVRMTERINAKLADVDRRGQDQDKLRVLDGLPLGTPEVAAAVKELSPDRFRAVLDLLATVTIAPVGKGGHVFNPERVQVAWR